MAVQILRTCEHPICVDPDLYAAWTQHFEDHIHRRSWDGARGSAWMINRLVLQGVQEHLRPHQQLGSRRPRIGPERAWLKWDPDVWWLIARDNPNNYWATRLRGEPGFGGHNGPAQWIADLMRWRLDALTREARDRYRPLPGIEPAAPRARRKATYRWGSPDLRAIGRHHGQGILWEQPVDVV